VIGKDSEMFFMWRLSHAGEETRRYASVMGAAFPPFMVRFLDKPNGQGVSMNVDETSTKLAEDQWLNFDVAYYAGTHQVWMDGKKFMEYLDTLPYPEGAIGFEEHLDQSKTTQFFLDDLVVCELTAPYEPPQ
jgi:hypothetical protein